MKRKWTEKLRTYGTVNKVNIRTGQQPYQHNPNFLRGRGNTNEEFIETLSQPVSGDILNFTTWMFELNTICLDQTQLRKGCKKNTNSDVLCHVINSTGEVGKIDTYPTYIIRMHRIL